MKLHTALLLVAALGIAHRSDGLEWEWSLREYVHTIWTHRDGIPLGGPTQIRQTTDGYLWFISDRTLIRFDGVRFVAVQVCNSVQYIEPGPDESLWVLCLEERFRLFRRQHTGRITEVPLPDLPLGQGLAPGLRADRRGRLWIYGGVVVRLEPDGTFTELMRVPGRGARSLVEDAAGAFWLSAPSSLIHIHNDRVEHLPIDQAGVIEPTSQSGMFVCGREAIHQFTGQSKSLVVRAPPGVNFIDSRGCLGIDRSGTVWVATRQHGVARVEQGRIETLLTPDDPGSATGQVFIDREDNIWFSSSAGLHRLRKPHARLLSSLAARVPSQPLTLFVDSRRGLWVGGSVGAVRLNPDHRVDLTLDHFAARAFAEDRRGQLWIATEREIGQLEDGEFRPIRDASGAPLQTVRQFRKDTEGNLWAIAERSGIYQVTPGPPRRVYEMADAESDFLFSAREGLWVAHRQGIRHLRTEGGWIEHDFRQGAEFYAVLSLVEIGDEIWVGDTAGLRRWRGGRWTGWTRAHGLPGGGTVLEIVADRERRLWLMTYGGIVALSRTELDATPDGMPRPLRFIRIGALDRVVSHPGTLTPSPRVVDDGTGRLYFATRDSVAIVEPSALRESAMRPAIVLESVAADNQPVDTSTPQRLTAPSRLQFQYTSLSLRSPENIRFRYQLEGYDRDWVEAGSARQVTYGTLPPATYRFRVIGSGSEGVWNDDGASYAFQIVPVFYNTWWFRTLAVALVAATIAAAHRLHVRRLTRQMQLRFEERLSERTRIAQDLHDTLLQGALAASWQVQLAQEALDEAQASPAVDEVRSPLRRAVQLLSKVADEGRATLSGLRAAPLAGDIADLLHQAAAEQPNHDDIEFRVIAEGSPRPLKLNVVDEIGRIACEAVVNAHKHSGARRIEVELAYAPNRFTCIVRDDGHGIDPRVVGRGRRGHWGLTGMRERAERAGGEWHLRSSATAGTEVEVTLHGRLAYSDAERPRRRWWRRSR